MLVLLQEALVGAYRKMGLENLWLPDLRYARHSESDASHDQDPGQTELGHSANTQRPPPQILSC